MQDLVNVVTTTSDKNCTCLSDLPLAYSYVPMQQIAEIYDNETGLEKGTLFPELYKPMSVYGKEFGAFSATDLRCLK